MGYSGQMDKLQEIALLYPEEIEYLMKLPAALKDLEGVMIDIGTFKGGSCIALGLGIKQTGLDEKVYTVDSYVHFSSEAGTSEDEDGDWGINGNMRRCFLQNITQFGVKQYIEPIFSDSTEFLEANITSIKMMFYDGSIMPEKVFRDLSLAAPYIVPDGLICLHDFHEISIYGGNVKEAVEHFLEEYQDFEFLGKIGEMGIIRKCGEKEI